MAKLIDTRPLMALFGIGPTRAAPRMGLSMVLVYMSSVTADRTMAFAHIAGAVTTAGQPQT